MLEKWDMTSDSGADGLKEDEGKSIGQTAAEPIANAILMSITQQFYSNLHSWDYDNFHECNVPHLMAAAHSMINKVMEWNILRATFRSV